MRLWVIKPFQKEFEVKIGNLNCNKHLIRPAIKRLQN